MLSFKYVTRDYDDAVKCSKRLTSDKVEKSVFKPILLYLRELRGDNVYDPEFGLRDSIEDIEANSNMYFQLTRDDSRNVRYYENGLICEPDSKHPDSVMIFLINGSLYLIDNTYTDSIEKTKGLLGKPMRRINDDSFVSRAKNAVIEQRKQELISDLVDHLDIALGFVEAPGMHRYEVKAVDPDLQGYSDDMSKSKGNSR